jgi:hypothetical protein
MERLSAHLEVVIGIKLLDRAFRSQGRRRHMIVKDRLMLLYLRVRFVMRVQTFVERYSEGQVIG